MADSSVSENGKSEINRRTNASGNSVIANNANDSQAQGQAQEAERQPTRLESFFAITKSLILRALVIYFITSFFRRPSTTPTDVASTARQAAINIFENGTKLDVLMYLSEDKQFSSFSSREKLIWELDSITYGDWHGGPSGDGIHTHSFTFSPSNSLKKNGSIYLHVYVVRAGKSPDPASPHFAGHQMAYSLKQLNRYKRQKFQKTHNLLTGETALTPEQQKIAEKKKGEVISHWHPNITVNLVTDHTNWMQGAVPPPVDEYVQFLPGGDRYKPIVYMNDFWNMLRDYQPINETVTSLTLTLSYQPISLFRWQLYFSQNMRNKWSSMEIFGDTFGGEEEDEDQDSLKEALLETSPYLLGATVFVSILHSVFELLAFKNDIQFWNNRKSLEGLSVRSVFFNVFQSVIVLLYVLDNDTNTIVRISCFIGLGIEIWKINKVVDIKINREDLILGFIPRISFDDKGSYANSSTREYDTQAFRYLSWAIYPLLGGYGIYSLLYQEHKGWYSWVLSMLYGFLLTFGFIMMTPQLFINYKLKSVAHLPWRMMTYKALNTFIDDIFAFVIKMPTMYRLGCFRDDIVFFIFLYQKFIYKTDLTRVNEFGFSGEMENEASLNNANQDKPAAVTNGGDVTDKKND